MSDGDASFRTRPRSISDRGELSWGETEDDATTESWSNAIESSTGITVTDTGTVQSGTEIPDSGIARYTFDSDDTDSGTAVDVWNGNDATINGATTGESGANQTYTTNEAYSFDGNDDIKASGVWDGEGPVSMFLWVKFDSTGAQRFLTSESDETSGSKKFIFRYDNGGNQKLNLFIDDGTGSNAFRSSTALSTGTWYHVGWSRDRNGNYTCWINGSSDTTASSGAGQINHTSDFVVGSYQNNSFYLHGDVDDVRVYSRELTAAEVSNLYNDGSI